MADTATFNQVVGSETLRVTIPVTRLEKLVDRVDALIEGGKLVKARELLAPYTTAHISGIKKSEPKTAIAGNGTNKKDAALNIIAANPTSDRASLIKMIQTDLGCTYANARYYVVNIAGK